jgi:hypothetical protein
VRIAARRLERGLALSDRVTERAVVRGRAVHLARELRDFVTQLADLALHVEQVGAGILAVAAGERAVRAEHLAVARHEQALALPAVVQRARLLEVVEHEHIAEQVLRERAVFVCDAHQVEQATDDAGRGRQLGQLAAFSARHRGDQRGAAAAAFAQIAHRFDASVEVAHDDVLQPLAERRRQRARQLGRTLDAVRDQAAHALLFVLRAEAGHHRAHAGADAFEALLDLFERAQARALFSEPAAQMLDALVARGDLGAKLAELFLELLARAAHGVLVGAQAFEARAELCSFLVVLRDALGELAALAFDAGEPRAVILAALLEAMERSFGARDPLVRVGDALAGLRERPLRFVGRGLAAVQLEAFAAQRIGLDLLGILERLEPRTDRRGLTGQLLALGVQVLDLALRRSFALAQARALRRRVLDLALEQAQVVVGLVGAALSARQVGLDAGQTHALGLELGLAQLEREAGAFRARLDIAQLRAQHAMRRRQLEPAMRCHPQLEVADLRAVLLVALGLLRLALERGERLLDLFDDVRDAQQVLLRVVHLAFSGLLLGLELGDARGLFDQRAAVFGLGRHDQADAALLDDRVRGLAADAGAQEQVGHVHQADGHLIDDVFAVAGAIEPAGDRDLGVVVVLGRSRLVGVVEG